MKAQCTLSANTSGFNAAYTQVYILTNSSNVIIAQNLTGSFAVADNNTYKIYALNYNPSDAPNPLPSALIGLNINQVGSVSSGCFNSDFLTDFVERSCPILSCAQTSNICINDNIIATTSGFNAAYTQVYVLTDDSGNFINSNNTGTFPTSSLTIGNIYHVHALNYNPSDPPTTLPSDLSAGDPISNITGGCFNSDFLSDYVCFNIINCVCTPTDVCINDNITATTSGFNAAYTQVYVLTDDSGNFIASNSTGTFPTPALTVGNIYHVHALNYNPSDPPTTLPSDLSAGDPISNITGGCFNSDFLSDYVCFNIINCVCTPTDVCANDNIMATTSGFNAAYTQVYVLTDDLGNFIASNSVGTFPASSLTIGNIYHVHALNYNPSDPPTTLPSDLSAGDPISNITGGCFNSDFLSDYVCFEITCSCGTTFLR